MAPERVRPWKVVDHSARNACGEPVAYKLVPTHLPEQYPGGAWLPAFAAADRSIVDTDVVLWHTVGTTHFTRPQDFPVMPCEYTGFTLKPFGFFDRNPGIDLAPQGGHCHP